jgi:hypothetical protein
MKSCILGLKSISIQQVRVYIQCLHVPLAVCLCASVLSSVRIFVTASSTTYVDLRVHIAQTAPQC